MLAFDSAEMEISKGQRDVVVRFQGAKNPSEAFQKGLLLAQQGLDLASIHGDLDAVIQNSEDNHVLWWTERTGLFVRLVSTVTMGMGIASKIQTMNSSGNIVHPSPIRPRHHIGFRYYRLAQTADDLYDAYRNMYLAFEALLSSKHPKLKKGQAGRKANEGERAWLERGLRAADADLKLQDSIPNTPDHVNAILVIIYDAARLPLFHAKKGEKVYAPHDSPSDRKVVSEALKVLTHIVLRMASRWYNASRASGMVMLGWVYEGASKLLEESQMLASDDDSPSDLTQDSLGHPRFERAINLGLKVVTEFQRGLEPAVFGHVSEVQLRSLSVLRKVDVVTDKHPLFTLKLESELTVDGISQLEVLMHVRAFNLNQPKSLFRR